MMARWLVIIQWVFFFKLLAYEHFLISSLFTAHVTNIRNHCSDKIAKLYV